MKLSPALQRRVEPLAEEAGRRDMPLYAVGGCVRDWLLGRETKDLDFVVESDPEPLARLCGRRWRARVERFDRFGTFRAHTPDGLRLDFVRARAESYPEPAALPVVRPGTLLEDLARRDFTINAMAVALRAGSWGEIIDPHGGQEDLRRKTLRVLHDESFRDDPTRLFRAARFLSRFSLKMDSRTDVQRRSAVSGGVCGLLSRERVRAELIRILDERRPEGALRQLKAWGLAKILHPRFAWPLRIDGAGDSWERLGLIALRMGPVHGRDFVSSLHLERPVSQSLLEALEIEAAQCSPRTPPSPLARRILTLASPRRPSGALEPLWINGEDLQRLGFKPGPEFRTLLEHAARAQWSGKLKTREQALRWLSSRVPE